MRTLLTAAVLSFGFAMVFSPAVSACINDSETVRTETEFKSRYNGQPAPGDTYKPSDSKSYWQPIAATGVGAGLLFATVGMVVVNVRRARRE